MTTIEPKNKKLRHCLTTALIVGAGIASAGAQDASRLDKLEKENSDLKKRLENIEALATKEGILPKDKLPNKTLKFLAESEISGFVTASYFYDFSKPKDGVSNGYLWTRNHNSISLNKAKLAIQRKAKAGDEFDVGYKVAMIWGQDAPIVNTGGAAQGVESIRDAYIEMHVPVGNGLNIKAGQLISLLNWESGDGGAVNANFSQGNQWFFTGNGPSTGVQVGYAFSDQWNLNVRVQNGLYTGLVDANSGKIGMASLGYKPDAKTGINFIGFGGYEPFGQIVGGSILASRQLTEKYNLTLATELDLFSVQTKPVGGQDYWSVGGWLTADLCEKVGVARPPATRSGSATPRSGSKSSATTRSTATSANSVAAKSFARAWARPLELAQRARWNASSPTRSWWTTPASTRPTLASRPDSSPASARPAIPT
jgi:hypothetical protein